MISSYSVNLIVDRLTLWLEFNVSFFGDYSHELVIHDFLKYLENDCRLHSVTKFLILLENKSKILIIKTYY